jgi:hypothetical protein
MRISAALLCIVVATVAALDSAAAVSDNSLHHSIGEVGQGDLLKAARTIGAQIGPNDQGDVSLGSEQRDLQATPSADCCKFLRRLSILDFKCFTILRRAELVAITENELACDQDEAGESVPALADRYERFSNRYIGLIDTALAGGFANVDESCLAFTPSTFTFACEPDVATITDRNAVYSGVTATNFGAFYDVTA